jgi:uncharacterized protein (DUF58 family)
VRPGRFRLRPPRRLHFHPSGWLLSVGAVALGIGAIGTGNNLLFLLLGAMLGFIVVSGWLSELTVRGVAVRRRVASGVTAGVPTRLVYEVECTRRIFPCFALEVGEAGDEARGFVAAVAPGATAYASVERAWPRRGVHRLDEVVLATSFPFGFFRKERDASLPAEVVVRPRSDRPVREVAAADGRSPHAAERVPARAAGARGEYRGLRGYRAGDDPRDVHWRSTARLGTPQVREYDREQAQALWICLDLAAGADATAVEAAVETAASVAARCCLRVQPFALFAGGAPVGPAAGASHLERVLDTLARVAAPAPLGAAPAPRELCVLVTTGSAGGEGWGDVLRVGADPAP